MTSSQESRLTVLMLWSYAQAPEGENEKCIFCPLGPEAATAVSQHVPAERIVHPYDLVSPEDRARFDRLAEEETSRFTDLMGEGGYPMLEWFGAGILNEMLSIFYFSRFWSALLKQLDERFGSPDYRVHAPADFDALPGGVRMAVRSLDKKVLERKGKRERKALSFADRLLAVAGSAVNRWPQFFISVTGDNLNQMKPVRNLVCGLQSFDSIHQRHLVTRMREAGIANLGWLVTSRLHTVLTKDEERAFDDADSGVSSQAIDTESMSYWKADVFEASSRRHVLSRIEKSLRSIMCPREAGSLVSSLAAMIEPIGRKVMLRYRVVDEALVRYNPQVVMGSSFMGDSPLVWAWCKRHKVTYIRMAHGVEFTFEAPNLWRGDVICVMGEDGRQELSKLKELSSSRIEVVGGGHIAHQALQAVKEGKRVPEASNPWNALFLYSSSRYDGYPDTSTEIETDFEVLARTIHEQGGELRVRCHPRLPKQMIENVCMRISDKGFAINICDSEQSLFAQLSEARIALIRIWSGAAIQALYAEVPLIGWLPRIGVESSSRLIRKLPECAENGGSFARILSSAVKNEAYRKQLLQDQETLLGNQIAGPFNEPFEGVVRTLAKTCSAVSSAC
ncbi:MAG: hypothetical protein KJ626_16115 [Verrucomicrobia bacterium]|nr:hypothetical protein [Verrucomicrobiota bacterium]